VRCCGSRAASPRRSARARYGLAAGVSAIARQPSSGRSSHGRLRRPTYVWNSGRTPGSPSSAPRRTEISGPSGHGPAEEARAAAGAERLHGAGLGGEYDADELLAGREPEALARDASLRLHRKVPECLRQREQWQWFALRNGS
jgi:hypothetical protein